MIKDYYKLCFSFFTVILFSFVYILGDGILDGLEYPLIFSTGFVFFVIYFEDLVENKIFMILSICLTLAILFKFVFFIISIIGIFLFIKSLKSFRVIFVSIVLSIIYLIVIGVHIIANGQSDLFYPLSLVEGNTNIDLFFHSTIASNYEKFGFCTTGLHGTPSFKYWYFSNKISSLLSNHLGIRNLDFYNYIYPVIVWTILLFINYRLLYFMFKSYINERNLDSVSILLIILQLICISFLSISPTWGPIQNFFKWEVYKVISIPLVILFILFSIFIFIELKNFKNSYIKFPLFFIFSLFSSIIICTTKLFLMNYILISLLLLILFNQDKSQRYLFSLLFTVASSVYLFSYLNNSMVQEAFSLSLLQLWKQLLSETQMLWTPFSFGFVMIVILFLSKGDFYINKDILKYESLRKNFHILILFSCFFLSILPTIFFGGNHAWNLFYFIDTFYILLSFPLTYYLVRYFLSYDYKRIKFSFSLISFFILLVFISAIGSGLSSFATKLNRQKNFLVFKSNQQSIAEVSSKNSTYVLCKTLNNLFKEKNKNSVLWVPKSNRDAWEKMVMRFPYGVPFVFSSLCELPQLFGIPDLPVPVLQNAMFGYNSYNYSSIPYVPTLDDALSEAKRFGYDTLYVLNSVDTFAKHQIN